MAAFCIDGKIGVQVTDAPVTTPVWPIGTRALMSDGTMWIYGTVPTSTAIVQYAACGQISATDTESITSTIGLRGVGICINQQTVSSDTANKQYLWFLIANPYGVTTYKVRVAASCAIDAKLATTAYAGTLDDTTAGTVLRVDGIVLTDSQPSGSSGSRTFRTNNYPLTWGAV